MQRFPVVCERLHTNLNLRLPALRRQLGTLPSPGYSYVMTTVDVASRSERDSTRCADESESPSSCNRGRSMRTARVACERIFFRQRGSGPNVEGDLIQGPLFHDKTFEFICIPDGLHVGVQTYGNTVGRYGRKLVDYFPEGRRKAMSSHSMHFDPVLRLSHTVTQPVLKLRCGS